MRSLLWLLAAGAGLFFILSIITLSGTSAYSYDAGKAQDSLQGFQNSTEVPGLKELKVAYLTKIEASRNAAEKDHKYWLWISFLVTALTAASTLVSSIKAAKSDESDLKKPLVLVAVFTFLASLGTWGGNQLNEARNTALQKVSALSEQRTKFYADFQKADDAQKADVVQRYKDDLDRY